MANFRKCSRQSVWAILDIVSASIYVCNIKTNLNPSMRTFSRTSQLLAKSRNFYDDLGIQRSATQSEIKHAYYNLSMVFHPDKNKGCHEASKTFRRITEAYEVLGNFRTRRLYDKGIGSYGSRRSTYNPGTETEIVEVEVEDDAQTKFYKQHMIKSQPPEMANRRTARDFDAWAAEKATESFELFQNVKRKREHLVEDEAASRTRGYQYATIVVGAFILFCMNSYFKRKHIRELEATLKIAREKKS